MNPNNKMRGKRRRPPDVTLISSHTGTRSRCLLNFFQSSVPLPGALSLGPGSHGSSRARGSGPSSLNPMAGATQSTEHRSNNRVSNRPAGVNFSHISVALVGRDLSAPRPDPDHNLFKCASDISARAKRCQPFTGLSDPLEQATGY